MAHLFQLLKMGQQGPCIAGPEDNDVHVTRASGKLPTPGRVEKDWEHGTTRAKAIHEPGCIEGRDIRSAACADDKPCALRRVLARLSSRFQLLSIMAIRNKLTLQCSKLKENGTTVLVLAPGVSSFAIRI
jgi:hypothetical protein